jgi:3-phenylpropionate/trans-cinnamate dioxygenase ferredoxin reductase subunit
VTLEIAGRPEPTDEVHLRGDVEGWRCSAVLTRAGLLSGCVSFNRSVDARAVQRLLAAGPVPAAAVADPAVDLARLGV